MRAAEARAFLDSNVVLYLLSDDEAKADCVERLLRGTPFISVQVLNEVAHVCSRKLAMDWPDIAQFLALVRGCCKVVPLTEDAHDRARSIAESHCLSFYDACIVATAIASGCRTLYSEDMNHGQTMPDGLAVRNPFAPA